MRIAILSANLGNFDSITKDPVEQELPDGITEISFHRFTDKDFPPVSGLTPRLQYRIPKLFGWEMFPGYDIYIWFDSACSLQRSDCVKWYLEQLGDSHMAFFRHPWRKTIKEEVEHIEKKLDEKNDYITSRYKNGLHRKFLDIISQEKTFKDDNLYASTAFVYRNSLPVQVAMGFWWTYQSRYFTCDQVQLPYALDVTKRQFPTFKVTKIPDNLFKIGYLSLVNHHK